MGAIKATGTVALGVQHGVGRIYREGEVRTYLLRALGRGNSAPNTRGFQVTDEGFVDGTVQLAGFRARDAFGDICWSCSS